MNRIGKYFTLEELTVSHVKLKNVPGINELSNLTLLVHNLLDPAREMFGEAITINSGYRSPAVNKAVGGAQKPISQHTKGQAADITCSDNAKLFNLICDHFEFDQLIWEKGDERQPDWIHVSYKSSGNRGEIIEYHSKKH
jgi:zinc D-Ala-D-Ala carboxypeptidase